MMKTARLVALNFKIICPWCKEAVQRSANGSLMFVPGSVKEGDLMTCTNEPCKRSFRLPTTLKAEIAND